MGPFQTVNRHQWPGAETIETRLGYFEFKGGYPTATAAAKLSDHLVFNRAVEAYLAHMPTVSWFRVWKGTADAGGRATHQMVIRENRLDAATLLVAGHIENVYGLAAIDLKRDGPVVVEVPPGMLGGMTDMRQEEVCAIGPAGIDKGQGGMFLVTPPNYEGPPPDGYITVKSGTYGVLFGVRGFLVEGRRDDAVAQMELMKSTRIYPLSKVGDPPSTTFVNGSGTELDTMLPDSYDFFEDLAQIVERETSVLLAPHERSQLASIGILHNRPFEPDAVRRSLLGEAVKVGSAMARASAFASTDPNRLAYPDRRWEWLSIGGCGWDANGSANTDSRAALGYAAIGMSPAMVLKIAGGGSQYFWTPRDVNGAFLDGGRSYRLHLPANVPVKNSWSVVVYDAQSRSMLRSSQRFPSISQNTGPEVNADGSVDIVFDPRAPRGKARNWIQTVEGRGWFPLLRFYGPLQPLLDRTWKPGDVEMIV